MFLVLGAQGVEGADPGVGDEIAEIPELVVVAENIEVCEECAGVCLFNMGIIGVGEAG